MKPIIIDARNYRPYKKDIIFQFFVQNMKERGAIIHYPFEGHSEPALEEMIEESHFISYGRKYVKTRHEKLMSSNKIFHSEFSNIFDKCIKTSRTLCKKVESFFKYKTQRILSEKTKDLADKWNAIERAKRSKIPVVKTLPAKKYKEGLLKYPLIVKHKCSESGKEIYICRDPTSLEKVFKNRNKKDYIIQPYIINASHLAGAPAFYKIFTFGNNYKNHSNIVGAALVQIITIKNFGMVGVGVPLIGKGSKKRLTKNEEMILELNRAKRGEIPKQVAISASIMGAHTSMQGTQFSSTEYMYDSKKNAFLFLGDVNKNPAGMGYLYSGSGLSFEENARVTAKVLADRFRQCYI